MRFRFALMKAIGLIILLFSSFSCTKKTNDFIGTWTVVSDFYKAKCLITEANDTIKGQVLYYNDDTTVYKFETGSEKHYFFKNIKDKGNAFVDAISGATRTHKEQVLLKLRTKDTLDVTTYVQGKSLNESWIRIK